MQAYHNDPAIKARYLARVRAHRAADALIHGVYWEHGRGCAVGCTIHSDTHAAYETELGIPEVLACLEDALFEALPRDHAQAWPAQFLEAIPVGARLDLVWPHLALRLLGDEDHGVLQHVQDLLPAQLRQAIVGVIDYYQAWVESGRQPPPAAAAAAGAAVLTAAASATTTAAVVAATYAATYAGTANHTMRQWQAQALLQLLREAPDA